MGNGCGQHRLLDELWFLGADARSRSGQLTSVKVAHESHERNSPGLTDTVSEATVVVQEGVRMPRPHPPEFRLRAVGLARLREKPVAQIAEDLGISDSCLRNWMAQADRD